MNNLDANDQMADYLRLANLRDLTGTRLRGRKDKEFAEMQIPDLSGTSSFVYPIDSESDEELGNFDVRANKKIEPPPLQQGPASQDSSDVYSKLRNLNKISPQNVNSSVVSSMMGMNPNEISRDTLIRGAIQPQNVNSSVVSSMMGMNPNEISRDTLIRDALQPQNENSAIVSSMMGMNPNEISRDTLIRGAIQPQNKDSTIVSSMMGMNPNEISRDTLIPYEQEIQNTGVSGPNFRSISQEIPEQKNISNPDVSGPNFRSISQEIPEQKNISNPGAETIPGSINQVIEDPNKMAQINHVFGNVDLEMMAHATEYENAMKAYSENLDALTARLNEEEAQILQRIESKKLTTQDKILMSIALVAPMIVAGLLGGKQGLLGAVSGGAKAFGEVISGREKQAKKNQENLSRIALDISKTAKSKAEIPVLTAEFRTKLADKIPNKELRDIFKRDAEILNDKLVINSGNPNLPIKAEAIRDVEDYKRIKKEISSFAEILSSTEQSMQVIDSMHKLLDAALSAQNNKNILQHGASYLPLYDSATSAIKAYVPWTRDTFKDENGNEVKISSLYNTLRTQLSEIWRKSNAGSTNSNAFRATEEHFFNQLPDPFSTEAFKQGLSDLNQNKKQLDLVKDKFTRNIISYLDEQGIDTFNVKNMIMNSSRNKELSDNERKKNRANAAADQAIRGK